MPIIRHDYIPALIHVETEDGRLLTVLADPSKTYIHTRQQMQEFVDEISRAIHYLSDEDIRDFNDRALLENNPLAFLREHGEQHPRWQAWAQTHSEEAAKVATKIHLDYRAREGYVYVVQGDQYFKIGCTANIHKRIQALNVKAPFPLHVRLIFPSDDIEQLEKQLHERFSQKRVRGEWFRLTVEDLAMLSRDYPTADSTIVRAN